MGRRLRSDVLNGVINLVITAPHIFDYQVGELLICLGWLGK
ncbi:MAG: hypothetical protein WBC61_09125 [Dehalococcoidia bacterium]